MVGPPSSVVAPATRVPMSARSQRILLWIFFIVVFAVYFGGGYYFGVIDRPRRHPAPIGGS